MLADASIHLTGILLLAPHLTAENHADVLARARFRTKREIQRLVAEIAPRPDVAPSIEPLGLRGAIGGRPALSGIARGVTPSGVPQQLQRRDFRNSPRTPSWAEFTAALAGAVRQLAPSNDRAGAPTASDAEPAPIPTPVPPGATLRPQREGPFPAVEPLSPGRYRVELTVDQRYVDLLAEARDLLAHQIPDRDLARVHERAMEALVKALRKSRYAATDRPRTRKSAPNSAAADSTTGARRATVENGASVENRASVASGATVANSATVASGATVANSADVLNDVGAAGTDRALGADACEEPRELSATLARRASNSGRHIPAALKRAVWERDQGRCTFVGSRGFRCRETGRLEFHHEQSFAKDGPMTLENLALRCRPHNDLAAEQDFGREHMRRKKEAPRVRQEVPASEPARGAAPPDPAPVAHEHAPARIKSG
jgi:5-methylcytosine-specific restriction endonuclease McrA